MSGICLDAQQVAATLGATVAPMVHKEIGFGPISLIDAEWSRESWNDRIVHHPRLLHWSELSALIFHPEVNASAGIERWLTEHAAKLAASGIDPLELRA